MLKQGILGSLTIACVLLGCSKPEQWTSQTLLDTD